jgi:cytochrome c553
LALAGILSVALTCAAAETNTAVSSSAVYVPDTTHANEPLPDDILAWNALSQTVDATNEQEFSYFTFTFTNISSKNITILNVHPSCGCTTAELPPVPWLLLPGTNGEMKITVSLFGKSDRAGELFKQVTIQTDQGIKDLLLRINVLTPPPMKEMTETERLAGITRAKADRQAVFKADCASCHLKKIEGKYGQTLYEAICTICHESPRRATLVPDLHNLPVTTSEEFWRTWITGGKAGTLMPAFAKSQGGPLNDLQIASIAAYLHAICPPRATPTPAK